MKRKFMAGLVALSTAVALVIGPAALVGVFGASAATATTRHGSFNNIPIKGNVAHSQKTFKGTMDIKRFVKRNGHLKAVSKIDGVIKKSNGTVVKRVHGVKRQLRLTGIGTGSGTKQLAPATAAAATCPVLHLTLGPLDLNLLGLLVHLDKVVLNIDAQSGPGNLLGNLVCAIAHLLDNPPLNNQTLAAIKDILNSILGILRL
jgi:hypothetical protein